MVFLSTWLPHFQPQLSLVRICDHYRQIYRMHWNACKVWATNLFFKTGNSTYRTHCRELGFPLKLRGQLFRKLGGGGRSASCHSRRSLWAITLQGRFCHEYRQGFVKKTLDQKGLHRVCQELYSDWIGYFSVPLPFGMKVIVLHSLQTQICNPNVE